MSNWTRTIVIGVAVAVLSAGGGSMLTGWLGDGVGVGGVRMALKDHAEASGMHPNVGQLEERLDNMEQQQRTTDSKVEAVQQSVDTLTTEVIRSLGQIEGKLDSME